MLNVKNMYVLESMKHDIYGCWDWFFPSGAIAPHKEDQWLSLMLTSREALKETRGAFWSEKEKSREGKKLKIVTPWCC